MRILSRVRSIPPSHSLPPSTANEPQQGGRRRKRASAARLLLALPMIAGPATLATAQTPEVLPGIMVQGATLDAAPKKARPSQAAAAPTQGAAAAAGPSGEGSAADTGGDAVGIPAEQTGTALTVVTGEQLRAQQIRHAGDALRSLP